MSGTSLWVRRPTADKIKYLNVETITEFGLSTIIVETVSGKRLNTDYHDNVSTDFGLKADGYIAWEHMLGNFRNLKGVKLDIPFGILSELIFPGAHPSLFADLPNTGYVVAGKTFDKAVDVFDKSAVFFVTPDDRAVKSWIAEAKARGIEPYLQFNVKMGLASLDTFEADLTNIYRYITLFKDEGIAGIYLVAPRDITAEIANNTLLLEFFQRLKAAMGVPINFVLPKDLVLDKDYAVDSLLTSELLEGVSFDYHVSQNEFHWQQYGELKRGVWQREFAQYSLPDADANYDTETTIETGSWTGEGKKLYPTQGALDQARAYKNINQWAGSYHFLPPDSPNPEYATSTLRDKIKVNDSTWGSIHSELPTAALQDTDCYIDTDGSPLKMVYKEPTVFGVTEKHDTLQLTFRLEEGQTGNILEIVPKVYVDPEVPVEDPAPFTISSPILSERYPWIGDPRIEDHPEFAPLGFDEVVSATYTLLPVEGVEIDELPEFTIVNIYGEPVDTGITVENTIGFEDGAFTGTIKIYGPVWHMHQLSTICIKYKSQMLFPHGFLNWFEEGESFDPPFHQTSYSDSHGTIPVVADLSVEFIWRLSVKAPYSQSGTAYVNIELAPDPSGIKPWQEWPTQISPNITYRLENVSNSPDAGLLFDLVLTGKAGDFFFESWTYIKLKIQDMGTVSLMRFIIYDIFIPPTASAPYVYDKIDDQEYEDKWTIEVSVPKEDNIYFPVPYEDEYLGPFCRFRIGWDTELASWCVYNYVMKIFPPETDDEGNEIAPGYSAEALGSIFPVDLPINTTLYLYLNYSKYSKTNTPYVQVTANGATAYAAIAERESVLYNPYFIDHINFFEGTKARWYHLSLEGNTAYNYNRATNIWRFEDALVGSRTPWVPGQKPLSFSSLGVASTWGSVASPEINTPWTIDRIRNIVYLKQAKTIFNTKHSRNETEQDLALQSQLDYWLRNDKYVKKVFVTGYTWVPDGIENIVTDLGYPVYGDLFNKPWDWSLNNKKVVGDIPNYSTLRNLVEFGLIEDNKIEELLKYVENADSMRATFPVFYDIPYMTKDKTDSVYLSMNGVNSVIQYGITLDDITNDTPPIAPATQYLLKNTVAGWPIYQLPDRTTRLTFVVKNTELTKFEACTYEEMLNGKNLLLLNVPCPGPDNYPWQDYRLRTDMWEVLGFCQVEKVDNGDETSTVTLYNLARGMFGTEQMAKRNLPAKSRLILLDETISLNLGSGITESLMVKTFPSTWYPNDYLYITKELTKLSYVATNQLAPCCLTAAWNGTNAYNISWEHRYNYPLDQAGEQLEYRATPPTHQPQYRVYVKDSNGVWTAVSQAATLQATIPLSALQDLGLSSLGEWAVSCFSDENPLAESTKAVFNAI